MQEQQTIVINIQLCKMLTRIEGEKGVAYITIDETEDDMAVRTKYTAFLPVFWEDDDMDGASEEEMFLYGKVKSSDPLTIYVGATDKDLGIDESFLEPIRLGWDSTVIRNKEERKEFSL